MRRLDVAIIGAVMEMLRLIANPEKERTPAETAAEVEQVVGLLTTFAEHLKAR